MYCKTILVANATLIFHVSERIFSKEYKNYSWQLIIRLEIKKLQYDIKRDAAKISALWSEKIDQYEYFSGKEIFPSNQRQMLGQAKFTYSPLRKPFEKRLMSKENNK